MRHPLIELLRLSNLLQMSNDCRMVNVELFSNFLCSFKRISFDHGSQLVVVNFQWPATILLIFKALVTFAKLLEPPQHCTIVSSSWAKGIVNIVFSPLLHNTLFFFFFSQHTLNSNKKNLNLLFCLTHHFPSLK